MEENEYPRPVVVPRPEHCLSRKNIDPDALKVMVRLHRHGFRAYLVGGSVRDLLLGREPKDFDVSTDARPGQIRRLFNNCRIIGRRFRLAHVYFRGSKIIEVSTFRKAPGEPDPEEETAGEEPEGQRRADNTFGRPYEDAVRRDLTINGLFYDIGTFSILDYVGGMDDLKAGVIRTIGPPDERFLEDPIRMLRVARHAVRTGFTIEPVTRSAVVHNAHLLAESNRFRLQDEYQKDLEGPAFGSVLRVQSELGLLAVIFPDLSTYLCQPASNSQAFFQPAWVWKALERLDGSTESRDKVKEYRVLSLVLPLIESGVTKVYSSLASARRDPTGLRVFFEELRTPFAIRRMERERYRIDLIAWTRLVEFVEVVRSVPPGFRKKAHFNRVLQWYGFHQAVAGRPDEEILQLTGEAIQAGQTRQGRPRRKRKERLRDRGKALDFS